MFISNRFSACDSRNWLAAVLDSYCGINYFTSNKLRSTSTSDLRQKIICEIIHKPEVFVILDSFSQSSNCSLNQCEISSIFVKPEPRQHSILLGRIWHGLPRFRTFWATLCSWNRSTPVLERKTGWKFLSNHSEMRTFWTIVFFTWFETIKIGINHKWTTSSSIHIHTFLKWTVQLLLHSTEQPRATFFLAPRYALSGLATWVKRSHGWNRGRFSHWSYVCLSGWWLNQPSFSNISNCHFPNYIGMLKIILKKKKTFETTYLSFYINRMFIYIPTGSISHQPKSSHQPPQLLMLARHLQWGLVPLSKVHPRSSTQRITAGKQDPWDWYI